MHSSIILLAVTFALATASPQAGGSNLPLGATCEPNSLVNPCANGASCYATNSMLIPKCGNFQASCSDQSQCAYNVCNAGFCNGPIFTNTSSTLYTNSSTTSTQTPTPTPPPTTTPIVPVKPTADPNTSARYVNSTTTLPPASMGYTTSIVIVNGQTSSVLVNEVGATSAFGATPTLVAEGGAAGLSVGMGVSALVVFVAGFAVLL